MRVLNASSNAANLQPANNKCSLSFGKCMQLPSRTLTSSGDEYVNQIRAMYNSSDSNGKIRIVGAVCDKLARLNTKLVQPFWERLSTLDSVKNEIGLYKRILATFKDAS